MPRVRKGAARAQKRKRIMDQARGYQNSKRHSFWRARLAIVRAGVYAYRDRRQRKRDMRSLWIVRITAACKMRGTRYSVFLNGLRNSGIVLNRKMLSEIAIHDPKTFDAIVQTALKSAILPAKPMPKAPGAKAAAATACAIHFN
ncbi:MAG: 50S ribosomal protein L20 [Phycisphaerales bacterium]|nr:50S ribosomal protein L20 [Phycisphaerales bacterium]